MDLGEAGKQSKTFSFLPQNPGGCYLVSYVLEFNVSSVLDFNVSYVPDFNGNYVLDFNVVSATLGHLRTIKLLS